MPSLKERIELLEDDMRAVPPRISVYHDLPFAVLRYDPAEEWELRREVRLLATRLETTGKEVHVIPMWRGADYFDRFPRVRSLYIRYEDWAFRRGHNNLATHYVVAARKGERA